MLRAAEAHDNSDDDSLSLSSHLHEEEDGLVHRKQATPTDEELGGGRIFHHQPKTSRRLDRRVRATKIIALLAIVMAMGVVLFAAFYYVKLDEEGRFGADVRRKYQGGPIVFTR